ncbi:hypothetical protein [Natronobiforma cellulositropha]|uniref:hypothetical protein n=1 Tax=Natronobiforma cellulositropha TaxID=1679076 RepID=UPI0021D5852B|nr:hypothetical protein [Natronobiforma cellulositropha]
MGPPNHERRRYGRHDSSGGEEYGDSTEVVTAAEAAGDGPADRGRESDSRRPESDSRRGEPAERGASRLRRTGRFVRRVATDLVAVGLWVAVLTWLFLARTWPRALFYVLLLVGILVYVRWTASRRA